MCFLLQLTAVVAVAYNNSQLKRSVPTTRGAELDKVFFMVCDTAMKSSSYMIQFNPKNNTYRLSVCVVAITGDPT